MKKKILSIIIAAVIAGTVVPIISTTPSMASAAGVNEGIRFDPNDPNFIVASNTVVHAEPKDLSLAVGVLFKGMAVKDYGEILDNNNVKWVKVKVVDKVELYGYVKESDLGRIYY